jgi:ABA4-like protein
MSPEQLFPAFNTVALAAWLLLAIFPRRPLITRMIAGTVVPALFAVAYIAMIASTWGSSEGGFSSLAGVASLFSNRWLLLAGWTHYLAFDLLVGVWEVRDSIERRIPHLLVVPCLALTFMFGPAGWLVYQLIRRVGNRWSIVRSR